MSDAGSADDLFNETPVGSPAPEDAPAASGSRSPAGSASPKAASVNDDDDAGDLFGDDDEEENGSQPRSTRGRTSSSTPTSQSPPPNPLEYAEEEGDIEDQVTVVNLPLPKYPRLQPTDGKVWLLKLPAYVNQDSKPYDADYYRATVNEEEELEGKDKQLAAKAKMLLVKNTIRWKWVTGPDGEPVPQSNAKFVRWSDGSMSLKVGADLFDIAPSHGATLARPQDLEASGQKPAAESSSISSTTFLCVPAHHERVLETETSIAGQLSLVPTSGTSKTHIELVKHVGQQHVKHSRMKILDDTEDKEKVNELLLKASGQDAKPHKPKSRRPGGGGGGGGGGRRASKRAASYDSGSDRGYGERRQPAGGGDYDTEDDFVVADDDEEEEAQETDDDDEAYGSHKRKSKSSRKRKGSEESLDEMELAERRIEERERERKRAKKEKEREKTKKSRDYVDTDEEEDAEGEAEDDAEGEAEDEEDMDMDVESEED